ncbi:methyltransferase domain-containing protein [Phosphitispora sp. TUW77]|uniref:methyltransferase domain-containing protein n=1 Tax=Phosphitispora sp. TUW77 TaxID=3152361 RepID=UPI003AB72F16
MKQPYINVETCWCGSKKLNRFSESYLKCNSCQTLISSPRYPDFYFDVRDDEQDIYGKKYWLERQSQKYGFSNIRERSKDDLSHRCIYWLSKVLHYKLPPAKTLELGCGHGGLVALMNKAGFSSVGAELSDWVVGYAQESFGIEVLRGKLDDLAIEPQSMDCIILMDVMEHFTDPKKTLEYIVNALKDNGLVIIQTPNYSNTDLTYNQLIEQNHIFLGQMKAEEHLYLFTSEGLTQILSEFGFKHIYFEPALFPYDMFVIASKIPVTINSDAQIEQFLLKTPEGRFVQAMLDLFKKTELLQEKIEEIDTDRGARLNIIYELDKQLKESNADREARLELINKLSVQLNEVEADRAARLELINELTKQLNEVQTDRKARLEVINGLNQLSKDLEEEISEKLETIDEIQSSLIKKDVQLSTKSKAIKSLSERLNDYEPDGKPTLKAKIIKLINKL